MKLRPETVIELIKYDKKFQKKLSIYLGVICCLVLANSVVGNMQEKRIDEAETKKNETQSMSNFLKTFAQQEINYKKDISQVQTKITTEKEIDQANAIISKLAENNHIKVNNSKKDDKNTQLSEDISARSFELNITGNYSDTMTFVSAVEQVPFFVSIDQVNLLPQKNNDIITTRLVYKIYTKKG